MTREELRDYVDEQRGLDNIPYHVYSTLIDGIDTLEQEPVLDKIRAEISDMMPPLGNWMYEDGHIEEQTACEVIADILQIIDKYKPESEG